MLLCRRVEHISTLPDNVHGIADRQRTEANTFLAHLCMARQWGTGPMPRLAISPQAEPTPSVWSRSNAARETGGRSTARLSECRQSQSLGGAMIDWWNGRRNSRPLSSCSATPSQRIERALAISCSRYYTGWSKTYPSRQHFRILV